MGTRPTGALADALVACGVSLDYVEVEWDELCQEDVLTFAGDGFPSQVLERLAELYLTFPSRFEFAADDLNSAFARAVSASPKMVNSRRSMERQMELSLEEEGLAAFPPFDLGRETLGDFARRVEIAVGFGSGELLAIQGDNTIVVKPKNPDLLSPRTFEKVLALVQRRGQVELLVSGCDAE